MPPKVRYTKEEIAAVAFERVRREGIGWVSARNLAAALGTSVAPIFTAFGSIEGVRAAVVAKAQALYDTYAREGMTMEPPFQGAGLQYIRFAKEEPKLFALLFMGAGDRQEPTHYFPKEYAQEQEIVQLVQKRYGMDEDRTRWLYHHLSVYAHGLAVMYAQGQCVFSDEDVSRMLSEVFTALKKGEEA